MRDTESVDTHTNFLCLRGLPSESMSFTSQSLKAIYVKTAMGITVCGIGCSFRYTKHLSRQVSSMQSLQIQTSGLKIRAKILLPER